MASCSDDISCGWNSLLRCGILLISFSMLEFRRDRGLVMSHVCLLLRCVVLMIVLIWDSKGEVLASGSRDGMVRLWDAAMGRETATLDADDAVEGLQWGAEGQHIAAVTSRGQGTRQVRIWDVAGRKRVFKAEAQYVSTWRPNQTRAGLFFSSDGKHAWPARPSEASPSGRRPRDGRDLPGSHRLERFATGRLRPPSSSLGFPPDVRWACNVPRRRHGHSD